MTHVTITIPNKDFLASKPVCDGVQPLKGILKSGSARDDHQKVVCFSGPAPDEHREPKRAPVSYPPGQQPHFVEDEDFCDRFKEAVSESSEVKESFDEECSRL